jgi:hypothetical protein
MVMALGETCWNNEEGYPLGGFTNWERICIKTQYISHYYYYSSFLYSWRCTSSAKYIEFLYKFFLSVWNHLVPFFVIPSWWHNLPKYIYLVIQLFYLCYLTQWLFDFYLRVRQFGMTPITCPESPTPFRLERIWMKMTELSRMTGNNRDTFERKLGEGLGQSQISSQASFTFHFPLLFSFFRIFWLPIISHSEFSLVQILSVQNYLMEELHLSTK